MAIAFAKVSVHSRSKGLSSVAGAAYRSGSILTDERTGETHDYTNRHDVVYKFIMLPDGADEVFKDRSTLWNAVEAAESRRDAQVAKDVILALPRELDLEKRIDLARQFAYDHFVKHGLAVDVALHDHSDSNPHAHLYVTTRRIIGKTLDRYKARDLNPSFANWKGGRGFISEQDYWDQEWRSFQTTFFEKEKLEITVDENFIIPQRHHGRVRGREAHYLKEENNLRREASIEITLTNPAAVLNELGRKYTVFTEKNIDQILKKNTQTPEQKEQALQGIKSSPDLVFLGAGDDGRDRFTTRANFQLESELSENAQSLFLKLVDEKPNYDLLNKMIAQFHLNSEQADALLHLSQGKQIAAIVGRAGTGKSYLMNAARNLFETQGFNVIGMAISGVAAKGLQKDSGIRSKTIAHYRQLISHDAWKLNSKSVVVMDEAGMTDLHDMAIILRHVKESGARMVLVGDHAQLQPIGIGAPFRSIVEMIGFAEMNRIMRQIDEKDAAATLQLSKGNVQDAIDHYNSKNQVHLLATESDAKNALILDWQSHLEHRDFAGIQNQLILAHKNTDVVSLNNLARDALLSQNKIDKTQHDFQTEKGVIQLAINDRLLFLKNDKELNVNNGDFATVIKIDEKNITAKLDNQKTVTFNANNYKHFTHGYAATVHKTQGVTLDNTFVYVEGNFWDRFLAYVALSRHRKYVGIYASNESYKNIEVLKKQVSRDAIKDSVLDFAVSFPIRRGFDPESVLGRFISAVSNIKEKVRDQWRFLTNYESYLKLQDHKDQLASKQERRERARILSEFIDLHRSTSKEWLQINKAIKSETMDKNELYKNKNYKTLILDTNYKNALAKKIIENIDHYQKSLDKNNISKDVVEKCAKQFDAQKSFNIDDAAKKAAEKMAEIDRKIAAIKAKNKDRDIER
ncbi:MAG: Ti-type conjugative transfer relaxase TraA [Gammaproteobacteria bacterium]|nr:Ti-type conjugative transfer relaxase TraA [Gammaproteobacteria bacterium]